MNERNKLIVFLNSPSRELIGCFRWNNLLPWKASPADAPSVVSISIETVQKIIWKRKRITIFAVAQFRRQWSSRKPVTKMKLFIIFSARIRVDLVLLETYCFFDGLHLFQVKRKRYCFIYNKKQSFRRQ